MSIWTHVLGSIRFDGIPGLTPEPDCGIPCTFEDDEKQWDKCNIPCGSEGSLIISIWDNSFESSLASNTISIFGDLRSFDDEQQIIDYFERITKGRMIRQAFYTFYVEGSKERNFIYKDKGFLEIK